MSTTFTVEYELMVRAMAFAFVIAAWMFTRSILHQPIFHPWLASLASALLAALAACVEVIPGSGPIPAGLTTSGVILAGLLFTAGVRFEASDVPLKPPVFITFVAVAAAVGFSLLLVPDTAMRIMIARFCVALCIAASLAWMPRFLSRPRQKLSAAVIGIFAVAVLVDRGLPLVLDLTGHDARHWNFLFPAVERSDLVLIVAAGIVMMIVSARRASRERVRERPT